jgi:hypothetical protein
MNILELFLQQNMTQFYRKVESCHMMKSININVDIVKK